MLQPSRNNTKYTFFISPFVVKASIITSLLEKCECLCAHLEDDALLLLGLESGLSLLSVSELSRWESISVLPPRLCLDLLSCSHHFSAFSIIINQWSTYMRTSVSSLNEWFHPTTHSHEMYRKKQLKVIKYTCMT